MLVVVMAVVEGVAMGMGVETATFSGLMVRTVSKTRRVTGSVADRRGRRELLPAIVSRFRREDTDLLTETVMGFACAWVGTDSFDKEEEAEEESGGLRTGIFVGVRLRCWMAAGPGDWRAWPASLHQPQGKRSRESYRVQ